MTIEVLEVVRNEGTKINVKTVRKVVKSRNLLLSCAKHKKKTNKRNRIKPSDIN